VLVVSVSVSNDLVCLMITKVQSLGTGPPASNVSVSGQRFELVDQFCYLGSLIDSSGRCRPDMLRRLSYELSV
jgi:hypothetical protein